MDRVMKISSNQSGAITASKNLIDFDLAGGMVYDLSKSYIVIHSSIETTDFDNIGGTSYSSSQYGSPGYSSWVSGNQSTNSFTLNSTAITAMNTDGYLNLVGRNIYYDADEEETPTADNYLGINQWEAADFNAAYRPRIDVTYIPIAVAWGDKMNGVTANVSNKYLGRLSSDITKINDSSS